MAVPLILAPTPLHAALGGQAAAGWPSSAEGSGGGRAARAALRPLPVADGGRGDPYRLRDRVPALLEELADAGEVVDRILVVVPRRRGAAGAVPGPVLELGDRQVPVGVLPADRPADLQAWCAARAGRVPEAHVVSGASGRSGPTPTGDVGAGPSLTGDVGAGPSITGDVGAGPSIAGGAGQGPSLTDDVGDGPVLAAMGTDRFLEPAGRWLATLAAAGLAPVDRRASCTRREELAEVLAAGPELVIYLGHGHHLGWSGYHGLRWQHLPPQRRPMGVVVALACATLAQPGGQRGFGVRLVEEGRALACLGAVRPLPIADLVALGDVLVAALPAAPTIGSLLVELAGAADDHEPLAGASFDRAVVSRVLRSLRVVGDPGARVGGASRVDVAGGSGTGALASVLSYM